jgi:hypothetical protein
MVVLVVPAVQDVDQVEEILNLLILQDHLLQKEAVVVDQDQELVV